MADDDSLKPGPLAGPDDRRDAALAGSAPDPTITLKQMVLRFLRDRGRLYTVRVLVAGLITTIWVVAQFGVPALLAGQALIDKWLDFKTAERESVTPGTLRRIIEQGEQTQRTAEQTNLTVRALGEDVERLDNRVQKIEDRHAEAKR